MRTFAQKQNPAQKKSSANLTRSNTRVSAFSRETHRLQQLQRSIGNQAFSRLLQARRDHIEAGANEVGQTAEGPSQTTPHGEEQIDASPIVHEVLASTGRPLDASPRAFMEHRFGRDFSRVRVHTDAKAAESTRELDAVAYTRGNHIAFGAGHYAPETNAGRRLLAHELTHVVQQNLGVPPMHGIGDVIQRDRRKPEKTTSEEKLVDIKPVPTRQALTDVITDVTGSISEKDWEDKKKAASKAQASRDSAGATKIYLELYTEIKNLAQADKLAKVFGVEAVDINIAKSEKDLKPGLNFSLSFNDSNGRTSFLDDKGVNHKAKLPVTLSGLPSIAILLGPPAFTQNKITALSTLRHEMMHAENDRSTINLLEKWQKQNKGKVSESDAESAFKLWLSNQKKSPQFELDLATESTEGGKKNNELLGYVEGFMTSFHLERVLKDDEISRGEVHSNALLELKSAGDHWVGAKVSVQSEALGRIKEYFCSVLDEKRQDLFDKWVTKKLEQATSKDKASEQNRAALAPIIPFLKNLKSIKKDPCPKKPPKKP